MALRGPARRLADDRGTVLPAVLLLIVVTAVLGVFTFQVGRAADLGAEAQTGADAAALAAATDLREQILGWILSGAWHEQAFTPDVPRARSAARSYAAANDVVLQALEVAATGYLRFDVRVRAATRRALGPAGYVSEDPATGERTTVVLGAGELGVQDAVARVAPAPGSFLDGGFWQPAGGGGTPTTSSGACSVPPAELAELAALAGVPESFAVYGHGSTAVPASQGQGVLNRYDRCDGPGVSVSGLTRDMKVSLLRLEHAMGVPLTLASAYRSPAYQAILCQRVEGPCAAPGRSMHNAGLAVDVVNHVAAAAAADADPAIGLCQPLPSDDAVHLSHRSGRECGGNTGTAGSGWAPYGGIAGLSAQAQLVVALVR
jgi:hypothetical protein